MAGVFEWNACPNTATGPFRFEMKYAKFIVLCVCAFALQGCISYSAPVYAPTQYVSAHEYDEEFDDVYVEATSGLDVNLADAAYYPWWSVDYYYLGQHLYRPASLRGPGESSRFSYGVPPYYWTYYGYFSPFYYPHSYYAWYDPWYGGPR